MFSVCSAIQWGFQCPKEITNFKGAAGQSDIQDYSLTRTRNHDLQNKPTKVNMYKNIHSGHPLCNYRAIHDVCFSSDTILKKG